LLLVIQQLFGKDSQRIQWTAWLFIPVVSFMLNLALQVQFGSINSNFKMLINSSEMSSLVSSINFGLRVDRFSLTAESLQLIFIFALICLVLAKSIFSYKNELSITSIQLGIISITFVMFALLKQFTRGGLLVLAVFASLPVLYLIIHRFKSNGVSTSPNKTNLIFISSLMILVVFYSGVGQNVSRVLGDFPESFSSVSKHAKQFKTNFFYNAFPASIEVEPAFLNLKRLPQRQAEDIFVLGNRSTFYWQEKLTRYWTISNWSAKSDAHRNLKILKSSPPKYVFFDTNPGTLNFDLVGSTLRDPDLFAWVIRNYEFHSSIAGGDLLVRKREAIIDYSYFATQLGSSLNIGALGYAISLPRECEVGDICSPYLKIQTPKVKAISKIEFRCEAGDFQLLLDPKYDRDYFYPLNEVWFWNNGCSIKSDEASALILIRLGMTS
jgi:hypothetical protein